MISLDRLFERDPKARVKNELAAHHSSLASISVEAGIPKQVKRMLETARDLSVYAFFVREFHQVARLVAFMALEVALKEKWLRTYGEPPDDKHQTLSPLLSHALEQRWIESRSFGWVQHVASVNARANALNALLLVHPQGGFEPPKITNEDIEREMDLGSSWANEWADHVVESRNCHAHGEVTAAHEEKHGKYESEWVIRNVVQAIGALFRRK